MTDDHIGIYDTNVSLWAECNPQANQTRLRREFRSVVARMHRLGWTIHPDPQVEKHWPILSPNTRVAHHGVMRMRIELRGRCIGTEIHLDEVFDNPNGHRYDHRRMSHMNGVQRLQCIVAMTHVVRKGLSLGYELSSRITRRLQCGDSLELLVRNIAEHRPFDDPRDEFNDRWQPERFARDETGWPVVSEYDPHGRNLDADGVPLRNGQIRYIRDPVTHRLIRGIAYTNMNEMWLLDTGLGRFYQHRKKLFSCDPNTTPRRYVPDQAKRLEREIERAVKAKDFTRVTTLSRVRGSMEDAA